MLLWTAFTIGLFGSLHCVGMCGPIALALPYQGRNAWATAANTLLYHSGRIVTYGFIGLLFGLAGQGLYLAGYQSILSIALGIILLIMAAFSISLESQLWSLPILRDWMSFIKKSLGRALQKNRPGSLFTIGILNGFLPCGMVYLAVAGALTTGSALQGAFYMMLFGTGTVPLMLTLSLSGGLLGLKFRRQLQRVLPLVMVVFALLLLSRGLNFDLPLDIRLWAGKQVMCK